MPTYQYECPACGPFEAVRPMVEYRQAHACRYGADAPRAMLSAPGLAGMDPSRRSAFATNERSANAPKQSLGRHPKECGCCGPRSRAMSAQSVAAPAKSFPAARPWMISH